MSHLKMIARSRRLISDVTFAVNFFRGQLSPPEASCAVGAPFSWAPLVATYKKAAIEVSGLSSCAGPLRPNNTGRGASGGGPLAN